jgi:hypothetical protein
LGLQYWTCKMKWIYMVKPPCIESLHNTENYGTWSDAIQSFSIRKPKWKNSFVRTWDFKDTYFCLSWTNTGELKADATSNIPVQFCFWDNKLQNLNTRNTFRLHNLTLPEATLLNHCLSLVIF